MNRADAAQLCMLFALALGFAIVGMCQCNRIKWSAWR